MSPSTGMGGEDTGPKMPQKTWTSSFSFILRQSGPKTLYFDEFWLFFRFFKFLARFGTIYWLLVDFWGWGRCSEGDFWSLEIVWKFVNFSTIIRTWQLQRCIAHWNNCHKAEKTSNQDAKNTLDGFYGPYGRRYMNRQIQVLENYWHFSIFWGKVTF